MPDVMVHTRRLDMQQNIAFERACLRGVGREEVRDVARAQRASSARARARAWRWDPRGEDGTTFPILGVRREAHGRVRALSRRARQMS